MSRSPLALVVLLFAALLVPTSPAQAAYSVVCTGYDSCEGKGYSHGGYAANKGKSYWNMYTGTNCTNYVAYRLVTTNGMPNTRPKSGVGNARDWGTAMASVTNSTPTVGSVAWWGKTGNHVAYVEKVVSTSEIWVSESNWSGAFDWRKITKSGSGWPDGFIHFADPEPLKIINEAKPAVVGEPVVDTPIKASGGVWMPKGNTYTYQWLADGAAISGATAKTFTPSAAHAGTDLAVRVTATRPSYPTVRVVSPSVEVKPGTFELTTPARVIGTPKVGVPLSAAGAAITPTATKLTYLWYVNGSPLTAQRAATFTPGPEHVNGQISVRVRSARTGYASIESMSARTAKVAPGTVSATSRPVISGKAAVGSRLSTSTGGWSRSGLSFTYQWRADGRNIPGATGSSYVLTAAERGKSINVVVTGQSAAYLQATTASTSVGTVMAGTFTSQSLPTVSGTPRVGATLRAAADVWSPSGSLFYQWYSESSAIAGATGPSYVLTRRDLGNRIRVRVTVRRDGFTSASALSGRTTAATEGRISISKAPRVTGSPLVGSVLKVDAGTHTPTNAALSYQWLRDGKKISGATKRTRRVTTADIGHRLTVKVTLRASGYSSRSTTTGSIGRAQSPAKISVSGIAQGNRKVAFSIKVSASGVSAPNGTVTIRLGDKRVTAVKVTSGRATITLTKQDIGRHTYSLTFNGTTTVAPTTKNRTVTVS